MRERSCGEVERGHDAGEAESGRTWGKQRGGSRMAMTWRGSTPLMDMKGRFLLLAHNLYTVDLSRFPIWVICDRFHGCGCMNIFD